MGLAPSLLSVTVLGCGALLEVDELREVGTSSGGAIAGGMGGFGAAEGAGGHGEDGGAGTTSVTGGAGGAQGECGEGHPCVDVPDGWNGPVARHQQAGTNKPFACEAPYALSYHGYGELTASGSCAACGCSAECQPGSLKLSKNMDCSAAKTYTQKSGGGCSNIMAADYPDYVSAAAPETTCTPSGGEPKLSPPTWAVTVTLCALPGLDETCSGTCVAWPEEPFEPGICVWQYGLHACPEGFPTATFTYYGGFTDTRACSACECTVKDKCQVTTQLKQQVNCGGATYPIANPSYCMASSSPHSFNAVIASAGSCTVSQKANVTGTAEPKADTALTVCCR